MTYCKNQLGESFPMVPRSSRRSSRILTFLRSQELVSAAHVGVRQRDREKSSSLVVLRFQLDWSFLFIYAFSFIDWFFLLRCLLILYYILFF